MTIISDVVPEWHPTHERKPDLTLPRGVFDKYGPHGELIETPTDHRMLWNLENKLAVGATNDHLREAHALLLAYLQGNCQHHWQEYGKCCDDPDCPYQPHRQCLWCNDVEWTNEPGVQS